MAERTFDFDAEYSDALIDDAARTFVHRLFRKYVWLLAAACVINVVGFVAVLVLPDSSGWITIAIGLLAALGPVYFPWAYFRLPRELAAPMKRVLIPSTRVSIASSAFTLSAKGRSITRRWANLKEIFEHPDYFLFVAGILVFTFVPKGNMPPEAQQLIREAAMTLVLPNPSMQPTGQQ